MTIEDYLEAKGWTLSETAQPRWTHADRQGSFAEATGAFEAEIAHLAMKVVTKLLDEERRRATLDFRP